MPQEKQATILVPDYITVRDLAGLIKASPIEVMKRLIANGVMVTINQPIDFDTASIVLEEMGFEAQSATAIASAEAERSRVENSTQLAGKLIKDERSENLIRRPPVVTILGHVDHGKTSLLDNIRKTRVAEGEAGGITQHIGAYQVKRGDQAITFLDTPGHEAFTQMRARGAQGADIAILVVAADDGVMQTTREALNHARAANVPIVVAITKSDKRNANIDRVKQMLDELGLKPDDWGGNTLMIPVNSLKGEGIDDLLEALVLTAEETQIMANPKALASGGILESRVDKNRGTLATVLVLNGTLKRGDVIIAGESYGRVKAMYDALGNQVDEAPPSLPVQVLGLNQPPLPGTTFEQVKNEKVARQMVEERQDAANTAKNAGVRAQITLEDVFRQVAEGDAKDLNLIIKVDVQGSLQPITESLNEIDKKNPDGVRLRVLSAEVGNIGENDVMLASASKGIVIAFGVDIDSAARRSAEALNVEIRRYDIIYKLFEDIELALKGMLDPVYAPKTIGLAEVRQVFKVGKVGSVAGSFIREGEARRNAKARVKRGGKVLVNESSISSLKRFQDDVREVRTGFECGISLADFNDFETGDLIEFFIMERVN
ncbi:MAG: translation initiation factor IF-2 [Anaerolineae bacterium]|jgi:translation initiation factor IF-2|nr:translation initiation factor IF-2 [Anaerolineae bacterium]